MKASKTELNVVYRRKKIKINIPMKFLFEENVSEKSETAEEAAAAKPAAKMLKRRRKQNEFGMFLSLYTLYNDVKFLGFRIIEFKPAAATS